MGAVWLGRDEVLGRQVALKRIGLLPGRRPHRPRARRARGAAERPAQPPARGRGLRRRRRRRHRRALAGDGVRRRHHARPARPSSGGPLSPDDAAPLLWQAADALVAAHAAGIVHRDVKPSNILVDRHWQVKLTDFGIARIATDASLTQTGLVTGSPAYLAPEVVTGGAATEAADVWSLGATLFHVLAGRPPYEIGDNVHRARSTASSTRTRRGWPTPAGWRRCSRRTLVKDPSQRWSMAQVRDFLGRRHRRRRTPEPGSRATPGAGAGDRAAEPRADRAAPRRPRRTAPHAAARRRRGVVLALVLAAVLYAVLSGGEPAERRTRPTRRQRRRASPSTPRPSRPPQGWSPSSATTWRPSPTDPDDRRGRCSPRSSSRRAAASRPTATSGTAPPTAACSSISDQPGRPLGQLPGPLRQLRQRPRPDGARPGVRGRPLPDRRRAHPGVHTGRLTAGSRPVGVGLPGVDEGRALEVVDRPVVTAYDVQGLAVVVARDTDDPVAATGRTARPRRRPPRGRGTRAGRPASGPRRRSCPSASSRAALAPSPAPTRPAPRA